MHFFHFLFQNLWISSEWHMNCHIPAIPRLSKPRLHTWRRPGPQGVAARSSEISEGLRVWLLRKKPNQNGNIMETLWKHNHYHHLSIIYHHLSHDMFIMLSLSPLSIINHYHTLSSWHMFVSFLDVLEYISWTESCLNMPLRLHSFECKPFLPWHIAYFVQHV